MGELELGWLFQKFDFSKKSNFFGLTLSLIPLVCRPAQICFQTLAKLSPYTLKSHSLK